MKEKLAPMIKINYNFITEMKEVKAQMDMSITQTLGERIKIKKLFLLLVLFCFTAVNTFVSFSQSEEERQEFYKKIMAKGETTIKSFNVLKGSIDDLVFSDDHDGYSARTEFQCVYDLFLASLFERIEAADVEFRKMNNFYRVPPMDYLNKMNALSEKKNALLTEGIRFFEAISTEVNSKAFKRWNVGLIDDFVQSSFLNDEFQTFKRLRPVSYTVFLLNRSRSTIAYMKCAFVDWHFMVSKEFVDLSTTNPLFNYNMVNHKLAVDSKKLAAAWQMNQLKINLAKDVFNYSNIVFWDYSDNALFSSWMAPKEVKNLLRDEKEQFSVEMANSNNALALVYLIKTLDFKNSNLTKVLTNTNLQIKNCTYDQNKVEFDYNELEYMDALKRVNSDSIVVYLVENKDLIKRLSEIVPSSTPWFYANSTPSAYLEHVESFDKESFLVYEIKHDLILASAYFKSICNDFLMSGLNDIVLKDWFNHSMEKNNFKAYYQNEYMLEFNKTNALIWGADKMELSNLLDKLRMMKLTLRSNSMDFIGKYKLMTNSNELNSFFIQNSTSSENAALDSFIVAQNNFENSFSYFYDSYRKGEKTASSLNSLGWRCLLNFEYAVAERFFKEASKLSKSNAMISLNLAHAALLKGDIKKARGIYSKFPLEQVIPELNLTVKEVIKSDFQEFEKSGVDSGIFEELKREFNL